jgi:hypothetical protein
MTAQNDDHEALTRLFQANHLRWGTPIIVAAPTLEAALEIASARLKTAPHNILVIDATEQFDAVSEAIRAHTAELRQARVLGVVDYDDHK